MNITRIKSLPAIGSVKELPNLEDLLHTIVFNSVKHGITDNDKAIIEELRYVFHLFDTRKIEDEGANLLIDTINIINKKN